MLRLLSYPCFQVNFAADVHDKRPFFHILPLPLALHLTVGRWVHPIIMICNTELNEFRIIICLKNLKFLSKEVQFVIGEARHTLFAMLLYQ